MWKGSGHFVTDVRGDYDGIEANMFVIACSDFGIWIIILTIFHI